MRKNNSKVTLNKKGAKMKTSNVKCRTYVNNRMPFQANNLFAENIGECYVVFSYGYHWPLFVFKDNFWYENTEKYSRTSSKHKSQSYPANHADGVFKRTTKELKELYQR
jgi:hypothetical protein